MILPADPLASQMLSEKLSEVDRDNAQLKSLVGSKNAQIVRLEAENVRLKLDRADSTLKVEVVGLRKEVGEKTRRLVECDRTISALKESESLAIKRLADAANRIEMHRITITTIHRSRDIAQGAAATAEQARVDAVREMVITSDRAAKAEARILVLEGKAAAKKPEMRKK